MADVWWGAATALLHLLVVTGLLGLLLVWIRVRWASLWPAVLAHNAINTAATIANTL